MTETLRPQAPAMADLLRTVRDYLGEITGELSGESRYRAQVAAYLLAMCERELAVPGAADDAAALSAAIRGGAHDDDWDALVARLLDETVTAVAVTKPNHLAPLHRERAR
jgi:hypothetical protein